jgi:hypothetical protein
VCALAGNAASLTGAQSTYEPKASLFDVELGAVNAIFFLLSVLWRWRTTTWLVVVCTTVLLGTKLFLAAILLWVVLTRSLKTTVLTLVR